MPPGGHSVGEFWAFVMNAGLIGIQAGIQEVSIDTPCPPSSSRPGVEASEPLLLFVGHGSRNAASNEEMRAFVRAYPRAERSPEPIVAFVELAEPSVEQGLDEAASRASHVTVVPLFLFASGHVKNDLPLALAAARRRHPSVRFDLAPFLGVHPGLVEVAAHRAHEGLESPPQAGEIHSKTVVLLVGRGSSDPDANGDFFKVARLLAEGRTFLAVEPCFLGIAFPRVTEGLERASRHRPERIVVVPYLLFAGRLLEKLQAEVEAFGQRYPWIRIRLASHLGAHPRVVEAVEERVRQAVYEKVHLACDTCQYRVGLPGRVAQVGGLRALLFSVRHALTHTQAAPHVHAHRPLKKHVLVCCNADCASKGSVSVLESLRKGVRSAGLHRDVRITKTSCLGRCGEGPAVVVYPDGVWYRSVAAKDADEIVRQHLGGDELVARLVDNIMQ